MGNAIFLPERIDANTARALIGNDKAYRRALARAPWVVSVWRAGRTITDNQAREIWERETFDGAARAALSTIRAVRPETDDSEPAKTDPQCAILALEIKLSNALAELMALRPLRCQARELPVLRGKLQKVSEDCDRLRNLVVRLERQLCDEKIENANLRRQVAKRTEQAEHKQCNDDLRFSSPHETNPFEKRDHPRTQPASLARDFSPRHDAGNVDNKLESLLLEYQQQGGDLSDAFEALDTSADGILPAAEIQRRLLGLSSDFQDVSLDDVSAFLKHLHQTGHTRFTELESYIGTRQKHFRDHCKPLASLRPQNATSLSLVEEKIAHLLLTYEDGGGDVSKAFMSWGSSSDGSVSVDCIYDGLLRLDPNSKNVKLDDVKAIFMRYAKANNGYISLPDFESFVATCRARRTDGSCMVALPNSNVASEAVTSPLSQAEMKVADLIVAYEDSGGDVADAFQQYTGDPSHKSMSAADIHSGLLKLAQGDQDIDLNDAKAVVKRFDDTDDGRLSWLEFESFATMCRDHVQDLAHESDRRQSTRENAEALDDDLGRGEEEIASAFIKFEDCGGNFADTFANWDKSGNGAISASEIHEELVALGHDFDNVTEDDVTALVNRLDTTEDGRVSLNKFESCIATCCEQLRRQRAQGTQDWSFEAESKIVTASTVSAGPSQNGRTFFESVVAYEESGGDLVNEFQNWAASSDGTLSVPEIHTSLLQLGRDFEGITLDDVSALLQSYGKIHDGRLSLLEFKSFVATCHKQDENLDEKKTP